ncbi:hypothetical protein DBR06_SOUSAS41210005, partial [Sousa chinensis]
HNSINLALVKLDILQRFLYVLQGTTGEISTELLKVGSGNGRVEIHTLIEPVNFKPGVSKEVQNTCCLLTRSLGVAHCLLVGGCMLLALAFEVINQVIHQLSKFSPARCVTSCGFSFKDAILD